jgi:hypothetical protein
MKEIDGIVSQVCCLRNKKTAAVIGTAAREGDTPRSRSKQAGQLASLLLTRH